MEPHLAVASTDDDQLVAAPTCITLSLRLPQYLYERLVKLSATEHRNLSEQIRHLIAKAPLS